MNILLIIITTPNVEVAKIIANALVSERLAACVNILPSISSIYRWEGKIQQDSEAMMIVKTTKDNFDAIKTYVLEIHPYECPEIISIDVIDGHSDYIQWVNDSCTNHDSEEQQT